MIGVGAGLIIAIVIAIAVVVGRKDTRYPDYSRLQYTLAESRESFLLFCRSPLKWCLSVKSLADSLR